MVKLKGSTILENIVASAISLIVIATVYQAIVIVGGSVKIERSIWQKNILIEYESANLREPTKNNKIKETIVPYKYDNHMLVKISYLLSSDNIILDSIKSLKIR